MFGFVPFNFAGKFIKGKEPWDRLAESFLEPPLVNPLQKVSAVFSSFKVDVKDTEDAYEVIADLPGFDKEEIDLSYQDKYLTISAMRENSKELHDGEKYLCRERYNGRIERSFYIDDIDEDEIKAEFKNGVLHVVLKKFTPTIVEEPKRNIRID